MSSIRQALRQAQEVLRTGFEAEGREIPRAPEVKVTWLDKIYRQNPPFTSYLLSKSKVWGISPCGRNDMILLANPMLSYRGLGYYPYDQ